MTVFLRTCSKAHNDGLLLMKLNQHVTQVSVTVVCVCLCLWKHMNTAPKPNVPRLVLATLDKKDINRLMC